MPSPTQQARSKARESLALPFFLLFCRIIAIPCKVYFFFSNPLPCPHKAGFLEHTTNFYCRTFALFYIKVEKPSFSTFMYFYVPSGVVSAYKEKKPVFVALMRQQGCTKTFSPHRCAHVPCPAPSPISQRLTVPASGCGLSFKQAARGCLRRGRRAKSLLRERLFHEKRTHRSIGGSPRRVPGFPHKKREPKLPLSRMAPIFYFA